MDKKTKRELGIKDGVYEERSLIKHLGETEVKLKERRLVDGDDEDTYWVYEATAFHKTPQGVIPQKVNMAIEADSLEDAFAQVIRRKNQNQRGKRKSGKIITAPENAVDKSGKLVGGNT